MISLENRNSKLRTSIHNYPVTKGRTVDGVELVDEELKIFTTGTERQSHSECSELREFLQSMDSAKIGDEAGWLG